MWLLGAGPIYLPQVTVDEQDRRPLFSWICEGCWGFPDGDCASGPVGWARILPMIPIAATDSTITSSHIPELTTLCGEHVQLKDIDLATDEE